LSTQLDKGWWRKLETALLVLLMLNFIGGSLSPPLPGFVNSALNVASYGLLFPLFALRWKGLIYVATRDIPLLLLLVMTVASVFWSAAPENSLTEIRPFLRAGLLGMYLARYYSIKEQIRLFTWIFTIAAILSLVLVLALPAYGTHGGGIGTPWKGIFNYKNTLARVMVLAAMLYLITAINTRRKRWVALTGFCLAIALILGSQGKTSLASLFILLCLFPIYITVKQNYKLQISLYTILVLVGGAAVIWSAFNLETIVVQGLKKDMTFNGRTEIWTLAIERGLERPWLGYGYVGFWTSDYSLIIINNTWASSDGGGGEAKVRFNSHNHFIDMFLQVGGLGFSLYILSYLIVFLRLVFLLSLTRNPQFLWMLQFVVGQTLFNLADSSTLLGGDGFWTIYVSIAFSTALENNRVRRKICLRSLATG
jgi:O-antigen ligase